MMAGDEIITRAGREGGVALAAVGFELEYVNTWRDLESETAAAAVVAGLDARGWLVLPPEVVAVLRDAVESGEKLVDLLRDRYVLVESDGQRVRQWLKAVGFVRGEVGW